MMKRVLILCSANSIRSPIAEGLWRSMAGESSEGGERQRLITPWEVVSAGALGAGRLHPFAERVLEEQGIDCSRFQSRSVTEIPGGVFDLVVTLSAEARARYPTFPGARKTIHWEIPDPTCMPGDRLAAFRSVRELLRGNIEGVLGRSD